MTLEALQRAADKAQAELSLAYAREKIGDWRARQRARQASRYAFDRYADALRDLRKAFPEDDGYRAPF